MTKTQGWIIIAELGILLYGLYYGAQQVQAATQNPAITGLENIIGSFFPARTNTPAQGATPIA